jgi:hypothetical protein
MTTTMNLSNLSMSKEDKQSSSRLSLKLTGKSILEKDLNIKLEVN